MDDTEKEALRPVFELHAMSLGFPVNRAVAPHPRAEPWTEYQSVNTGHRWAGYLDAYLVNSEAYAEALGRVNAGWIAESTHGLMLATQVTQLQAALDIALARLLKAERPQAAPHVRELTPEWVNENVHSYFSHDSRRGDNFMWANVDDIHHFARAIAAHITGDAGKEDAS
jgi:hypothetical protein